MPYFTIQIHSQSSLHLAHHILLSPQILGPSSSGTLPPCIELGAGTGFLSILLSQLGSNVITTDLDGAGDGTRQAPLDRLRGNVLLSQYHHAFLYLTPDEDVAALQVEALDWMDSLKAEADRPDVWRRLREDPRRTIIAADVVCDLHLSVSI